MNTLATFWKRLRSLFRKTTLKGEIDEELRFHLEQRITDNIAAGMSPEEAARNARRRFGGVQNIREECREARGADLGESLFRDIQFGLRILIKNPAFALVSILSLAVGMAANVVVFSCLNAALFRAPLGVRNPERLVHLREMVGGVSYREFEFLRDHNSNFFALTASASCRRGVRLKMDRNVGYPGVRFVSANYFSLIGEPLSQGRPFLAEEDQPGSRIVAIVSQNLWKRQFNSDPDLVGTTLMLRRVQTGILREYGFDTQNIMVLDFSTPSQDPNHFQPALIRLLTGIPGVKSASIARIWYARYLDYHAIRVDGQMPHAAAGIALSRVTSDYFGTLGIPFVQGRNFTPEEAKAEAPLLIVSESFAKRFCIRMALGAQRPALLRLLLWEGMRLVSIGMAIGLIGSACLSTVLRSFFYGLSRLDPVTFLTVSLLLALAGLLACFFPARRAASVDPMRSLRYE